MLFAYADGLVCSNLKNPSSQRHFFFELSKIFEYSKEGFLQSVLRVLMCNGYSSNMPINRRLIDFQEHTKSCLRISSNGVKNFAVRQTLRHL